MGLLAEDIPFHSNIPRPVDTTVAVVYSVFGELSFAKFKNDFFIIKSRPPPEVTML